MTKKEFLALWLMEWGRGVVYNKQLYAHESIYMKYIGISRMRDIERVPILAEQGLVDRTRRSGGFSGEWQYRLSDKGLEYIAGDER
jgi:hypothetical protein